MIHPFAVQALVPTSTNAAFCTLWQEQLLAREHRSESVRTKKKQAAVQAAAGRGTVSGRLTYASVVVYFGCVATIFLHSLYCLWRCSQLSDFLSSCLCNLLLPTKVYRYYLQSCLDQSQCKIMCKLTCLSLFIGLSPISQVAV